MRNIKLLKYINQIIEINLFYYLYKFMQKNNYHLLIIFY